MHSPHKSTLALIALMLLVTSWLGLAPAVSADETVIYSIGFETGDGGYTVDGTALWEWGTPTTVGPDSAHSGSMCWGTDLDGELQNKEGYLTSSAISIPALSEGQVARVRFYGWIQIPWMYSRGEFFVSSNGTDWQSLAQLFSEMDGGWQLYEFDVSDYAGGDIYLKWRCYISNYTSYGAPDPGFYIDDVAITVYDSPGDSKIFTFEAQEDASSYASCPWIYTWNGTEYVRDNDIYSVARYAHQEQHDWYLLQETLVEQDGVYPLEVREVESEISWTDMVGLITVDHEEGVGIAPDSDGNISSFVVDELVGPITAVTDDGENVIADLSTLDDSGVEHIAKTISIWISAAAWTFRKEPYCTFGYMATLLERAKRCPTSARQPLWSIFRMKTAIGLKLAVLIRVTNTRWQPLISLHISLIMREISKCALAAFPTRSNTMRLTM